MFLIKKPSNEQIQQFVLSQRDIPFSYSEVGATRDDPPGEYTIDHNRRKLGAGARVFERAVAALKEWKQFDLGWVQMVPAGTPIEAGSIVAILTKHFGFWSLNACRVVYLINEDGPVKKFGFAYGTLASHVERGEERFTIEWHADDDSVWYDILAFSRPNKFIVKLGLPLTRMLQKRFARDSLAVLAKTVDKA
jgi:uncharacterized protein (UPF0548 family)